MITAIKAAQRLDSRGNPTIQVDLETSSGSFRSIVPSGASTGQYEAVELRDEEKSKYDGKGVLKAVRNVEKFIGPALIKKKFDLKTQLKDVDQLMRNLDGTPDKSRLGANAILGVSMACARAGYPVVRILPARGKPGQRAMVYHRLKKVIADKYGAPATGIGDEGGFAPPITKPEEAFDLLDVAVAACGYTGKVKYAMDSASVEFFRKDGSYDVGFKTKTPNVLASDQLQQWYTDLLAKYPIVLLEDPFSEDDWPSWTSFNKVCPVELVGDDLLATNPERVRLANEKKACNSMLLKVNQIGTVTEAIDAANLAFRLGWSVFVSHRSGETTDDFIADLTVGLGTGHLKTGSPCRGERIAKYNRLMDIEAELKGNGKTVIYAGEDFRFPPKLSP